MITLITGGSGSGKSAYAESLLLNMRQKNHIYIATMEPYGKEGARRIARHRAMRADKNFETIECQTHLEQLCVPVDSALLLECISNLCANECFSKNGRKEQVADWILKGIVHLMGQTKDLVIVSNNVFEDGTMYDATTLSYMRILGEINRRLAASADQVIEVVCGIPICLKKDGEPI